MVIRITKCENNNTSTNNNHNNSRENNNVNNRSSNKYNDNNNELKDGQNDRLKRNFASSGIYDKIPFIKSYKHYSENNLKEWPEAKTKNSGIYNTCHGPRFRQWRDQRYSSLLLYVMLTKVMNNM